MPIIPNTGSAYRETDRKIYKLKYRKERQGQDRGLTLPAGSRLMSSLGQLFETVQTHIPSHTIYELIDARIHG
jgi:hypothetical protein